MPTEEDPLRGAGRTTGLMLVAIGTALLKPDEWVEFTDHYERGPSHADIYAQSIRAAAYLLGITVDVEVRGGSVWVRSPFAALKANRCNA